jgi:hypothetical protein
MKVKGPLVPPEKSQDNEKFRSARKISPSGKPALRGDMLTSR